jgi:transposase
MLPQELGCVSGMTCWRRVRDWQQAGVWDLIHFALLDWLARSDEIDWSRAVVEALALVDAIPALYGGRSRPRFRPDCVLGDRGYDAAAIRRGLRLRHIVPLLAMRRTAHGSGLGRWRWVVERTFAWLNQFRRLRVRYDKRADIHEAFVTLACALICWKSLRKRWVTA